MKVAHSKEEVLSRGFVTHTLSVYFIADLYQLPDWDIRPWTERLHSRDMSIWDT